MKSHHLLLAAVCSVIILAGGSFTCHSGDDNPNRSRHTLVAPVFPR
jgi:hypothetical protein